jgi:hypothetical protein
MFLNSSTPRICCAATLALAKKSKEGGPDVDALAYLKETARLKPAGPEPHAHMIPIYIRTGKADEAKAEQ